MEEIAFDSTTTFNVLGTKVSLFQLETEYGNYLYAYIGTNLYVVGEEHLDLSMAISSYEEFFDKDLTNKEISQVLDDNK